MGTIVLLASFLLAASANPIANTDNNYFQDASDTHNGAVSSADDDSQSSNPDNSNQSINNEEKEASIDNVQHSTENDESDDTEEHDISHHNSADSENSGDNTGDEHPSSVDNDSTTPTKVSSEDNENKHADDAATSGNSPDSTDSTQPSTGGDATNPTEIMTTSSDTTVSTTPTKTETTTQQSTEEYTTPGDADPKDCRNATETNHTYLLCSYSCQLDEMFVAPENSPCYLHPSDLMTDTRLIKESKPVEGNANETGVCRGGSCVPRTSETPAAPAESSPGTTTAKTGGQTESPTSEQTSTQQSNETYTTPGDADPNDCRNATEPNHVYLLCTFSCQQDEVFTAPNDSLCYLYPPIVTGDILINQEYNHSEHKTNETGVCYDGQCVQRSTEAPAAPAESSPRVTTTTAAETNGQTESPISEKTSVTSAEPNDVSESLPVPSPFQNTPTENRGRPENQGNVSLPEVEKTSSRGTDVSVSLPAALPGIRN